MSEKLKEALAEYEADSERTGVPVEYQLGVEAVFYRAARRVVEPITDEEVRKSWRAMMRRGDMTEDTMRAVLESFMLERFG